MQPELIRVKLGPVPSDTRRDTLMWWASVQHESSRAQQRAVWTGPTGSLDSRTHSLLPRSYRGPFDRRLVFVCVLFSRLIN